MFTTAIINDIGLTIISFNIFPNIIQNCCMPFHRTGAKHLYVELVMVEKTRQCKISQIKLGRQK